MTTSTSTRVSIAMLFAASSVAAQARDNCPSGPGTAFGIVAYQCANCGFRYEKPGRPSYEFFTEPVVTETTRLSVLNAGDVIEAVNGKPITTSAGSEAFAYTPGSEATITVRRGRDRQVLSAVIPTGSACDADASQRPLNYDDIESVEVIKGPAAVERYGPSAVNGAVVVTTKTKGPQGRARVTLPLLAADTVDGALRLRVRGRGELQTGSAEPIYVVDGVVVDPRNPSANSPFGRPPADASGKFGFGVACKPSCTAATATEGTLHYPYYRYFGNPPIIMVRRGSIAERAGLKFGDLIVKVDGHSITEESGAKILARLDWTEKVKLTVRRDGKDIDVTLQVP